MRRLSDTTEKESPFGNEPQTGFWSSLRKVGHPSAVVSSSHPSHRIAFFLVRPVAALRAGSVGSASGPLGGLGLQHS